MNKDMKKETNVRGEELDEFRDKRIRYKTHFIKLENGRKIGKRELYEMKKQKKKDGDKIRKKLNNLEMSEKSRDRKIR